MRLLPIGTQVYIRKGTAGHNGLICSSDKDVCTSIQAYSNYPLYPYVLEDSTQIWAEDSLIVLGEPPKDLKDLKPFESTDIEGFGKVLRLPNGYVFSNQVTFIPSLSNSLQD